MAPDRAKSKKLVIFGAGEFAEIAYEYFTYDSDFEVVAFSVERAFVKQSHLFGLPVIALDEVETKYPPGEHQVFVAITFTGLNRVRARLYGRAKAMGYPLATYISSKAFVWRNAEIGENCFIFENNVIQYRVKIGNDVVLWSGNHIGHRSTIGNHCFVSSHVVISGYCNIGESCFFGVNSCLADTLDVGSDCVIGAGAVVVRPAESQKIYVGNPANALVVSSLEKFGIKQ
jgi:sugar O-acyltransferase (sialic acid O-acetyltransferase NeuD family)